jgi:hypothetical protein
MAVNAVGLIIEFIGCLLINYRYSGHFHSSAQFTNIYSSFHKSAHSDC